MPPELDDLAFRASVFAWLRARMLTSEAFSRDSLSEFEFAGSRHRLVGAQTGIRRVPDHPPAAISTSAARGTMGSQ